MKETELSVFKTDSPILNIDRSVLKNERIVSLTGLSEENTEPSFLKEERREEETLLGHKFLASWRQ